MRTWRRWLRRLGGLLNRKARDRELDDELESHVELSAEDNVRLGMGREEARRQALIQLGGMESVKEAYREQRGLPLFETLWQDIRYGARILRKNRGFTAVAVLTLALGIGANTVVLSVAKGILFRPLVIDAPEQVVWLRMVARETGKAKEDFSFVDLKDLRTQTKSFEELALIGWPGATWEEGNQVEHLTSLAVSPSLMQVIRVRPILGRPLEESDGEPGSAPVALISHELWHRRFGADPNILGKKLRLDEQPRTVIGVLPPRLEFPLGNGPAAATGTTIFAGVHDVWLPIRMEGADRTARGNRMHWLIGRLKPGVPLKSVQAELAALGDRWAIEFPETNRGLALEPIRYRDQVLGSTRKAIYVLAAAVAAVLLISCVNLANLLLARGVFRQREWAVRSALGAGRGRMLRTLFTESALLSLGGGILGILLADVAVHLIRSFGPEEVPFIREIVLDGIVIGLTATLCLATAGVFGLVPALWQSRIEGGDALKSGARLSAGPRIRKWQQGLLIGQIAVVLVLLTSAGLLLESFRRLMGVDLGYQPKEVIALDLGNWGLPTNEDGVRLYREIRARVASLPGVEAVGTIQSVPLTGKWTWEEKAQVFGRPLPLEDQPSLAVTFVAFDYFGAMRIPLVSGRFFREEELRDDGYAPVAILNEAAAASLFPDDTPLGRRFAIQSSPDRYFEIVGIVKDTRDARLEQRPQPRFYLLYTHGGSQLLVRGSVPAQAMIPLLRATLNEFRPRVFIAGVKPMSRIVSDTVAERRFLMAMLVTYAGVALGIAAVGIFGVMAYQVAQRTNEFGIRLALGARPGNLIRLVLGQAGRLAMAGLGVGLVLTLGTSRLLASQLFGLSPHDPLLLAMVSLLLLAVGMLASFFPARRAAHVDPMVALRNE